MGDAADHAFDLELQWQTDHAEALAAGCRPCAACDGEGYTFGNDNLDRECPKCKGFGWFDKDGNPCEIG